MHKHTFETMRVRKRVVWARTRVHKDGLDEILLRVDCALYIELKGFLHHTYVIV